MPKQNTLTRMQRQKCAAQYEDVTYILRSADVAGSCSMNSHAPTLTMRSACEKDEWIQSCEECLPAQSVVVTNTVPGSEAPPLVRSHSDLRASDTVVHSQHKAATIIYQEAGHQQTRNPAGMGF